MSVPACDISESKGGHWLRALLLGLVFVAGVLFALPDNSLVARQAIEPGRSIIELSWWYELPVRFSRGEYAGRDFAFVRGPLYQFLKSLGLWVQGGDLASVMRFESVPERILACACVWALIRLLCRSACLCSVYYLVWAGLYEATLRPLAGLLLAAWFAQAVVEAARFPQSPRKKLKLALTAALGPFLLLLYSFDFGIMMLLSLVGGAAALACTPPSDSGEFGRSFRRAALEGGGMAIGGMGLLALILSLIPGWHSFFVESWRMASEYAVNQARGFQPGSAPGAFHLMAGTGAALAIAAFAARSLRKTFSRHTHHFLSSAHLLILAIYGAFWSRYGYTRSDGTHVWNALVPAFFLVGCAFACFLHRTRGRKALPVCLAGLLFLLQPVPGSSPLHYYRVKTRPQALLTADFSRAYLDVTHFTVREATLQAIMLPGDYVYVWPYEQIVGLLAGKKSPDYTLSSVMAFDEKFEARTIQNLASVPQLPVILFTGSLPFDGVENWTHSPDIFQYLLNYYELAAPPFEGFAVLKRAGHKRHWVRRPVAAENRAPLPRALPHLHAKFRNADFHASQFCLLKMRAARTYSFGLFKPGRITATFHLSSGQIRRFKILLPPDGQIHEILLCPTKMREPGMLSTFTRDREWVAEETVDALDIEWAPLDFLSRAPRSIELLQVEILERADTKKRFAPQSAQRRPEILDWLFEGGPYPPESNSGNEKNSR